MKTSFYNGCYERGKTINLSSQFYPLLINRVGVWSIDFYLPETSKIQTKHVYYL